VNAPARVWQLSNSCVAGDGAIGFRLIARLVIDGADQDYRRSANTVETTILKVITLRVITDTPRFDLPSGDKCHLLLSCGIEKRVTDTSMKYADLLRDRPQQDRRLVLKATAVPIAQFKSRPD
jgi:hypothetical protein